MSKFDLGAFLAPEGAGVSESDTMREIPVEDILDNPRNFYPRPDNAALAALMDSIEANGLLEPPTVVPAEDGRYRLISGHSRMTALRLLAANKDAVIADRFALILCRVLPPMTPAQEECAVIEANRQRIKTPALLAQEAERLTEMYVKRREAGEELPGRIRDRVAEAMQVSKTKLANLSAIRNGLRVPAIRVNWEHGLIPEAAALVIARMDLHKQQTLWDWMVSNHKPWTINNVQEFERICTQVDDPVLSAADKREESERYAELLLRYRDQFSEPLRRGRRYMICSPPCRCRMGPLRRRILRAGASPVPRRPGHSLRAWRHGFPPASNRQRARISFTLTIAALRTRGFTGIA